MKRVSGLVLVKRCKHGNLDCALCAQDYLIKDRLEYERWISEHGKVTIIPYGAAVEASRRLRKELEVI